MKLKAFTILELTMAMLLSTIVIGMIYAVWNMADDQLRKFDQESSILLDHVSCITLLEKEFQSCQKAEINHHDLILVFHDHIVGYEFLPEEIKRFVWVDNEQIVHHSPLANSSIYSSYQGRIINNGMIDKLNIEYYSFNKKMNISLFKNLSSEQLIKNEAYVD